VTVAKLTNLGHFSHAQEKFLLDFTLQLQMSSLLWRWRDAFIVGAQG
jgi:hypothetical protein